MLAYVPQCIYSGGATPNLTLGVTGKEPNFASPTSDSFAVKS